MKWTAFKNTDDAETIGTRGTWMVRKLQNGQGQAYYQPAGETGISVLPFAIFGSPAEARLAVELYDNPYLVLPNRDTDTPENSRIILDADFKFIRSSGVLHYSKVAAPGSIEFSMTPYTEISMAYVPKNQIRHNTIALITPRVGSEHNRALFVTDVAVCLALAEARLHANGHYRTPLKDRQEDVYLGILKRNRHHANQK